MNRGKLLISLLVAAALSAGAGSTVLPASAQQYSVTVKLPTGGTTTITVSGGCPGSLDLGQVISCTPIGSPEPAPAPQPETTPAQPQTDTTPDAGTPRDDTPDDEPTTDDAPSQQPSSGGSRGDRDRAPRDRDGGRRDEGSSRDEDSSGSGSDDRSDDGQPEATNDDGTPSLANPTTTVADPGPVPIGVPNFVIDKFRIPPFLLPIYRAAEAQYNVPWQILCAINNIETNFGQNLNVSSAGALGWMQFIPSTWKMYGTDANGDGRKDPYNPVDAIFSAARYLKAAGAPKDMRRAIFAYNHANWYVESVLLRAKVICGMPEGVVGSLTTLVEGRFPVAAKARYADQVGEREANERAARSSNAAVPVTSEEGRESIDIFTRQGAPVIAVNDGRVVRIGQDSKRGRYVVLEDYAGNRYTYSQLGGTARSYPVPKEQDVSQQEIRDELGLPADPKPTRPASAGSQPTPRATPTDTPVNGGRRVPANGAGDNGADTPAQPAGGPVVRLTKERLFANPTRPMAYGNGGREQIAATSGAQDFETYGAYFARVFGLDRDQVTFKPMRVGAEVVAGTILGRVGKPEADKASYMTFGIRPAGEDSPNIDPKPILDGWKLLESTAIYRAKGVNPFLNAKSISVGQMMLMTKEQLGKAVLSDPRIEIYDCGRNDIKANRIDKRVLITLKYLAGNGLRPSVSSLICGHSKYVAGGGRVSDHWYGRAVDIAAINGIPMLGNQQDGSVTDIAIRRILQLKGFMTPSQIISLRTYAGADNTLAMGNHDDHIHVGFGPAPGQGNPQDDAVLKPRQWLQLIDRLGEIDNPRVPIRPSRYSLPADPTGRRGSD